MDSEVAIDSTHFCLSVRLGNCYLLLVAVQLALSLASLLLLQGLLARLQFLMPLFEILIFFLLSLDL